MQHDGYVKVYDMSKQYTNRKWKQKVTIFGHYAG